MLDQIMPSTAVDGSISKGMVSDLNTHRIRMILI